MARAARRVRAGILLETMIGLAIFAGAAIVLYGISTESSSGLSRAQDELRAVDLARTALSRIEAGLSTASSMDGPIEPWDPMVAGFEELDTSMGFGPGLEGGPGGPGMGFDPLADPLGGGGDGGVAGLGFDPASLNAEMDGQLRFGAEGEGWNLLIDSVPSAWPGLTLLSVTAFRSPTGDLQEASVRHTLHQLVRLAPEPEDRFGNEADDLTRELEELDERAERFAPSSRERRGTSR